MTITEDQWGTFRDTVWSASRYKNVNVGSRGAVISKRARALEAVEALLAPLLTFDTEGRGEVKVRETPE